MPASARRRAQAYDATTDHRRRDAGPPASTSCWARHDGSAYPQESPPSLRGHSRRRPVPRARRAPCHELPRRLGRRSHPRRAASVVPAQHPRALRQTGAGLHRLAAQLAQRLPRLHHDRPRLQLLAILPEPRQEQAEHDRRPPAGGGRRGPQAARRRLRHRDREQHSRHRRQARFRLRGAPRRQTRHRDAPHARLRAHRPLRLLPVAGLAPRRHVGAHLPPRLPRHRPDADRGHLPRRRRRRPLRGLRRRPWPCSSSGGGGRGSSSSSPRPSAWCPSSASTCSAIR